MNRRSLSCDFILDYSSSIHQSSDVTPSDNISDRTPFGGVIDWYQEPSTSSDGLFIHLFIYAFIYPFIHSIILFRIMHVILFGTILDTTLSAIPPTTHIDTTPIPTVSPTIPPSPDYTPTSPDYTPASPDYSSASDMEFDPSKDPSSDHIPPLPATLPFLSSIDDSSDSDIPDTPSSPTYGTPFTETTLST
ncbi:hypothetical protein Tco_0024302 [Tanacetum coccineum]